MNWRNDEEGHSATPVHDVGGPLRLRNWGNLVGYILNTAVTFGLAGKVFGSDEARYDSNEGPNQTIVTPAGYAFSIWGIIFLFQGFFAGLQMMPRFRCHPLILSGVAYWYLEACIFQTAWVIFAYYNLTVVYLILMICIWLSLIGLVLSQRAVESSPDFTSTNTLRDFWLFKFPFDIHCGWITAATAVNVNIMVVASGASVPVQLASGIISLAVLHAIAVFVLFVPRKPNYTIPLVLSWANIGIAVELKSPDDSIKNFFSEEIIIAVQYSATTVAIVICGLVLVRFFYDLYRKCRRGKIEQNFNDGIGDAL